MEQEIYQQIIQLIDDTKVEEGINAFRDWANVNKKSELRSSLTVLKMRYTRVKRQERAGIIQLSKALSEYAFVRDSVLDFLNSEPIIEDEIATPTESKITNTKKTILFLASMPSGEAKLQLEKEFTKIYTNLQDKTDNYELKAEWAVKPNDLQKAILKYRPHIIHFSGHGSRSNAIEESGLLLEDKTGKPKRVSASALTNMFKIFSRKIHIQIVILNACYSIEQANSIKTHIPYVIGMKKSVEDETSLEFSSSFYQCLAAEESDVEFAFDMAVNAIQLEGLEDSDIPVILKE